MSCDPTWEVCDSPAPASTDASAAPADGGKPEGVEKQKAAVAKNVALIFANMLWSSTLASAYGVGASSDLVSRQQANAFEDDGTDVSTMRDSSTWKATKYLGFLLLPWGTAGWIVFLANNLLDGKGGMLQQSSTYFVKSAGPVGLLTLLLTLWRSLSRKSCDDDATQWQCTLSGSSDTDNYKNSGYAQRTRQSTQLGLQMLMIFWFTNTTVQNGFEKAQAANAKPDDKAPEDADASTADASADASSADASSSSDNAW